MEKKDWKKIFGTRTKKLSSMSSPKNEKGSGIEKIFEEMPRNIPYLARNINVQIQEAK